MAVGSAERRVSGAPHCLLPSAYCLLRIPPRGVARGPCPLEVVAAEVAGHVQDLADEVEAGGLARLQSLGRKLVGRDAAARDLRLLKTFGAGRQDAPVVE